MTRTVGPVVLRLVAMMVKVVTIPAAAMTPAGS